MSWDLSKRFALGPTPSTSAMVNLQLELWKLATERFERIKRKAAKPYYVWSEFAAEATIVLVLAGAAIGDLLGMNASPDQKKLRKDGSPDVASLRELAATYYPGTTNKTLPDDLAAFFNYYDTVRHFCIEKRDVIERFASNGNEEHLCAALNAASDLWQRVVVKYGQSFVERGPYVFALPPCQPPSYAQRLRDLQKARQIFDALFEECQRVRNLAHMYDGLFIDRRLPGQRRYRGPSKRHLRAKSAVRFFTLASKCMYMQWHLQTARLADPARTFGRENLSVHQMNERLATCGRLTPRLEQLAAAIDAYAVHTRPVRHRLGAHNDLETHLEEVELGAHPDAVVAAFFRDLNEYTDHAGRAVGRFRGKLSYWQSGGADDLLRVLEAGLKALDAKRPSRK